MNVAIYDAEFEPDSRFTEFIKGFQWEPMSPPFDPEVDDAIRTIKGKCVDFLKNISDPALTHEVNLTLQRGVDEVDVIPNNFFTALLMLDEEPNIPSEYLEKKGVYKSGGNVYEWDPENNKVKLSYE